mmetsp:Transcript_3712/g.10974  ORF Transcript_3712/g.10974 Transcript_3712/m.10974 type:complete len:91 (-) Transcript_3712:1023-1295(-)
MNSVRIMEAELNDLRAASPRSADAARLENAITNAVTATLAAKSQESEHKPPRLPDELKELMDARPYNPEEPEGQVVPEVVWTISHLQEGE